MTTLTSPQVARLQAGFESLNAPGPIPTSLSLPFWEATAQRRMDLQCCEDCGSWVFYPRGHCPHCWGAHLTWRTASGQGKLKTYSWVNRPGHVAWQAVAPYALGLVQLAEGPTMLSTLLTEPGTLLQVGMPVHVAFVQVGKFTLPMFSLVTTGAAT